MTHPLLLVAVFLLVSILLTVPGYLLLRPRFSVPEAFSVGYFVTLAVIHLAVVALGAYAHVSITTSLVIGTAISLTLGLWAARNAGVNFTGAIREHALLSVLFIPLCFLFIYPFARFWPFTEPFDYFVYWGFIVKKFFFDNTLLTQTAITDYSAYNYPILNANWSLIYHHVTKAEILVRYKQLLLFPFLTLLGFSFFRDKRLKTLSWALLNLMVLLVVAARKQILMPDVSFSAHTELPFALFMLISTAYYLKALKTDRLVDLATCWLFSLLASQIKYDGIVFHAVAVGVGVLAFLKSCWNDKRTGKLLALAGLFFAAPFLWIGYEKFFLGRPGSFQNFSVETGLSMFLGVAQKLAGHYSIPLFMLAVCFAAAGTLTWKRKSLNMLGALLPVLAYLVFLVFIMGAEWKDNWYMVSDFRRLFPRVFPVFFFLFCYLPAELFIETRAKPLMRIEGLAAAAVLAMFLIYESTHYFPVMMKQFSTPVKSEVPVRACLDKFNALDKKYDVLLIHDKAWNVDDFHQFIHYRHEVYPVLVSIDSDGKQADKVKASRWVRINNERGEITDFEGNSFSCGPS